MIWPPPQGNLQDPEFLKSIMQDIPFGAKMSVLVAGGLGVFVGGVVARIITRGFRWAAWIVGAVLLGAGFITMLTIPHPMWMKFNAVTLTLAGAVLANLVTRSRLK